MLKYYIPKHKNKARKYVVPLKTDTTECYSLIKSDHSIAKNAYQTDTTKVDFLAHLSLVSCLI